ncbi:MAG: insulinase family protein [Pseudomonadota bacterium]
MNDAIRRLLAPLCALGLIAGCAHQSAPDAPTVATKAVTIAKSPNDDRSYRYLTLKNRMQVLLVSDPQTDKAAASLVVQRGSFHEPANRQGLAHFLEHMLFIGTAKYPEVDAYQQFIGQNGGSSNAYTAMDHTNYFFDINPPQYRQAMDRFAQFFISPLFEAQYVEREKNAVNSEYQLQSKDDGWRGNAAQKLALNPAHPGSRFTIGRLDTLDEDVRADLLTFFDENYSADQMILVALSNESLDELADWVVPMFEAVPDRDIGPAPELPELFRDSDLPAGMNIATVKENYRLSFEFPVPSDREYLREKPLLYITNLLGHEGDGSLHQALKARGWIESLSTSSGAYDDNVNLVSVDVELTDAGREQVPAITRALFDQIELLRSTPPSRRLFTEQAQMLSLAFRFQERSSPTGFVYRTAPALMHTPPAEVLREPYLMSDFDPALIQRYLALLTPDNLIRTLMGPEVATDATEPWFEVDYALQRGTLSQAETFAADLRLPEPNAFLPERVDLVGTAGASRVVPELALRDQGIDLWSAADIEFGAPRANLNLTLAVPGGIDTPEDRVRAELYARLVADSLNEFSYPAYLAGLSYRISASASGFELRVSGYDDKQPVLLEKVLEAFTNLTIDPERLALSAAELAEDWRGFASERPYTQAFSALNNLLVSNSAPADRLASAISAVTPADLASWVEERLQRVRVEGLIHGNVRSDRVLELADLLKQYLPLADFPIQRALIAEQDTAARFALDIDHPDAAMVLYLQSRESSYAARAQMALAVALMKQSYFTALRTNDQLGYVVSATYRPLRERPGLAFVVQSPVADPAKLAQRTTTFVRERQAEVAALSPEAFKAFKAGLISNLLEKPKNLAARTGHLWRDLTLGELSFNARQQMAAAVNGISQTEAVDFLDSLPDALAQRQLLIYSTGKFDQAPERGTLLSDYQAIKDGERG